MKSYRNKDILFFCDRNSAFGVEKRKMDQELKAFLTRRLLNETFHRQHEENDPTPGFYSKFSPSSFSEPKYDQLIQ